MSLARSYCGRQFEVELRPRIVEPVGVIGARDVDRAQAPRRVEIGGDGGIVDGLVHRDVVELAFGRRIVERGEDGVDEIVDMDEVAPERAPMRVAQQGMSPPSGSARRSPGLRASSSPGRRNVVAERQRVAKVVLLHDPGRAQA